MDVNTDIIAKIIGKQLKNEVEKIAEITRHKFNVYIYVDFPEVLELLKIYLKLHIQNHPNTFHIEENIDGLDQNVSIPVVLVGNFRLKPGLGFARYDLSSADKLIGHVGKAVEQILNHYKIHFYLDTFDGPTLQQIKEIAKIRGIQALIDAVVQTAYLGGFRGKSEDVKFFLERFNLNEINDIDTFFTPIETCAKKFLSHTITLGENAHAFLKASLSYYVVNSQGHNLIRASKILNVSRTTLSEHLKIAEKMGISTFFEGKSI